MTTERDGVATDATTATDFPYPLHVCARITRTHEALRENRSHMTHPSQIGFLAMAGAAPPC